MGMVQKTADELAQQAIASWSKYIKSVDEFRVKLAKIHQEFNEGVDKIKGDIKRLNNINK
jgi:ABC-type Zn uptake system ZnuABC Zn-binding protein ZnuA